jgi:hypothetical protein
MATNNAATDRLIRAVILAGMLTMASFAASPAASAQDADPLALQRWLCTFFNAPHDARPGLLRSAPVTYAERSDLQHERRQVGTQGGYAETWTIGRLMSHWRTRYTRQGREGRPNARFRLQIEGDRGLVLADDASVRLFFERFGEPVVTGDEYAFRIPDSNEPDDEVFDRFVITFDIRSQDMDFDWSREEHQSYGRAFCLG